MTPNVVFRLQDLGLSDDPHPLNTIRVTLSGPWATRLPARDLCEAIIKLSGGALTSASLPQITYYRLDRPAEVYLTVPQTYPVQELYGKTYSFAHQTRGTFTNPRTTRRRVFLNWVPPTFTPAAVSYVAATFCPPGFTVELNYGGRRDRHLLLTDADDDAIPHYVELQRQNMDPLFILVTREGRMPVCALCGSLRHLHTTCRDEASRPTPQPRTVNTDASHTTSNQTSDHSQSDTIDTTPKSGGQEPPPHQHQEGHPASPPNDATAGDTSVAPTAMEEEKGHSPQSPQQTTTNATTDIAKEEGHYSPHKNTNASLTTEERGLIEQCRYSGPKRKYKELSPSPDTLDSVTRQRISLTQTHSDPTAEPEPVIDTTHPPTPHTCKSADPVDSPVWKQRPTTSLTHRVTPVGDTA